MKLATLGAALGATLVLAVAVFFGGCAAITQKAPVTGRSQLILIGEDKEKELGLSEADNILKNSKLSTDKALTERVVNVGKRIVAASEDAKAYAWDFYVLEDSTINAFALPGGKVFFYTGILKIMANDDQIASVMGHEIAHVLARHGAERISQQQLAGFGGELLSAALKVPAKYQSAYQTAYGAAANVGVILPYSRKHESEADAIGVELMYKAGYNPNEAVKFWKTMAAQGGGKSPEFLSTHPSDSRRINDIEARIKKLK
ncbi:MAG: M48 family metallopeptidase [Helicobacteraceae bacterium]|jgi:predicted Zn-dependent protease|nr:M48 family metallopeptidase [Helicobacteraceae bacterium]